jgi:sugar lactone lactonase YvrE
VSEISIKNVTPQAAVPGGEVDIEYSSTTPHGNAQPDVRFGDYSGQVTVASSNKIMVRVPELSADSGTVELRVSRNGSISKPFHYEIGKRLASNLYPVSNPAVDTEGNVYVTYSGRRGQKTPVSVYKITPKGAVTPFATDIMNATGLAFSMTGELFVSSRYDGNVYSIEPSGHMRLFTEGMGIATGIAFDRAGNLYIGDRSGSVFKISPDREIFVFATLEPSLAAYHMAFGMDNNLYITGPTTSSFDSVYRVTPNGEVDKYFTGLGRPQGLAVDIDGNVFVIGSYRGRHGVFQIRAGKPKLIVAGMSLVGMAFDFEENLMVTSLIADSGSLYKVRLGIMGKPLP